MTLVFGYKVFPELDQPVELLEHAILAERYGFKSLWLSDHFHPWTDSNSAAGFAWVLIASAAEKTKTMRIGTAVTAPILRYHPAVVAQAFATLGATYPGRIFLGLGTGEALNESPLGYLWPTSGRRVEMLEEAIIIIKMLWNGGFVDFNGKYYTLKRAKLYTRPDKPVRIYVAAGGPRVAELAGRLADGIILLPDLEKIKVLNDAFLAGAKKAGRDSKSLDRIVEILVSYDEDYEKALKSCRRLAAPMLPLLFKYDIHDPKEIEAYGKLVGDEAIAKRWIIGTTPEEHIRRIRDFIKMGANHLYFGSLSPNEHKFLQFYAKEVLPNLGATT
ncbi:MAG: TIGR03557 family F420-dependent LLM class oxidoreductase [Candidatus Bathyarchaeia archaeon]